jgi:hypothetical protein
LIGSSRSSPLSTSQAFQVDSGHVNIASISTSQASRRFTYIVYRV